MAYAPLISSNLVGLYLGADAQNSGGATPSANAVVAKVPNRVLPGTNDAVPYTGSGASAPTYKPTALDGRKPGIAMDGIQGLKTGIALTSAEAWTILVAVVNRYPSSGNERSMAFDNNTPAKMFMEDVNVLAKYTTYGTTEPRAYPYTPATLPYTRGAGVPNVVLMSISSNGAAGVLEVTLDGVLVATTTDATAGSPAWANVAFGSGSSFVPAQADLIAGLVYKGRKLTATEIKAESVNIGTNLREAHSLIMFANSFGAAYTLPNAVDISPATYLTGVNRFAATQGMCQRTADALLTAHPDYFVGLQAITGMLVRNMLSGGGSAPWANMVDPMMGKTCALIVGEPTNDLAGGPNTQASIDNMIAFANAIKANGASEVALTGLWIRNGNDSPGSTRQTVNTALTAFADATAGVSIIRADNDARWQNINDTTMWNVDLTHPTALQHGYVQTDYLTPFVNAFFAPVATGGNDENEATRLWPRTWTRTGSRLWQRTWKRA